MLKNKGQISIVQFYLLFIVIVYTPAIWFLPSYVVPKAAHAAWLSPTVTLIPYFILLFFLKKMYDHYGPVSAYDIVYDITSKGIGKIILLIYAIWITIMLAVWVRFSGERLVTTVYPNTRIEIFMIVLLVLCAYVLRSGLVVLARMNEIIFAIITSTLLLLIGLMLPNVDIKNLTPVTLMDAPTILSASIGPTSMIYLPFLLVFTNEISNIRKLFRTGVKAGIFLWVIITLILVSSIGTIGHSLISKSPSSFLVAVKYINILDIIGGFESFFIIAKIFADFIAICLFTYIVLKLLTAIFNLRQHTRLLNIYLVLIYFLSLILASNFFELQDFTADVTVPINIILQLIVPSLLFIIGKLRKKF